MGSIISFYLLLVNLCEIWTVLSMLKVWFSICGIEISSSGPMLFIMQRCFSIHLIVCVHIVQMQIISFLFCFANSFKNWILLNKWPLLMITKKMDFILHFIRYQRKLCGLKQLLGMRYAVCIYIYLSTFEWIFKKDWSRSYRNCFIIRDEQRLMHVSSSSHFRL